MSEVTFADERTVVERFVDAEGRGSYSMAPPGFHGFGRDSRAITVANGRRSIQQMASKMQLNSHNVDTALSYFKMAVEYRFIQGRKTEHVVAACLYVVCRLEQTSHMLLDFADLLQVNVYSLATCFIKLCRRLHLNMPVIDPVLFIPRFAHQLDFGEQAHEVGKTALRLVSRMKRDWIHVGRRPAGICGAGLLLAARLHGFSRTQKEVIHAVRVCDSTLRKRLEEFEDTPSSALTVAEFQSIELEGEADPPSFKRHQAARQQQAIDSSVVAEMEKLADSEAFLALEGSSSNNISSSSSGDGTETAAASAGADKDAVGAASVGADAAAAATRTGTAATAGAGDASTAVAEARGGSADSLEAEAGAGTLSDPTATIGRSSPTTTTPTTSSKSTASTSTTTTTSSSANETVKKVSLFVIPDDIKPTLSDVEDGDLEEFFMSSAEVEIKTKVWTEANKEYLEKQEAKLKQAEYERLHGITKPARKRRRRQQKPTEPAADAEAAVQQMLAQKKVSKKINYALLERLMPGEGAGAGAAVSTGTTAAAATAATGFGAALVGGAGGGAAATTASVGPS